MPGAGLPGPTAIPLFAELELLKKLGVSREVVPLDVVEQLAPPAGHSDQAAAGVKVLPVGPEVLGQRVDSRREQSDLDIAGTGVRIVNFKLRDDFLLIDLLRHVLTSCTTGSLVADS